MPEIVVVGSFTVQEGKEEQATEAMEALTAPTHGEEGCILSRAPDLFADGGDIVVYEARPGGETTKGSIAAHAAG